MKTSNLKPAIFLLVFLPFLQGCSTSYLIDEKAFFKSHKYEDDKQFKMRDGNIQAPMISQKGQTNVTIDFIHGFNFNFSTAVSKKVYITAGGNYLTSKDKTTGSVNLLVTENYNDGISSSTNQYYRNFDYTLSLKLEELSIAAAAGFYKTFSENGRLEYCAGIAHGKSTNIYKYDFPALAGYNSKYTFKEQRNYYQYFAQTDFGYVTAHSEGAIIGRFSMMHFTKRIFTKSFDLPEYKMENDQFVFQPAFKFGVGKTIRYYLQTGWNIPIGNSQLKWFTTNVQAGIIFRINDKSSNKK